MKAPQSKFVQIATRAGHIDHQGSTWPPMVVALDESGVVWYWDREQQLWLRMSGKREGE